MIKNVEISNVNHGNRQIVELENNRYIIFDLGDGQYTLDGFVDSCEKKYPNETPHITLIISHVHSDHTGGLDDILYLHKTNQLKIDTVYMNMSVLKSEALVKILETDEKIEIKDFSDNKEELMEILGYALLSSGNKEQIKSLIKEFNEDRPKNQKISFDDIKKFSDLEKDKIAKEYYEKHKEVLEGKNLETKAQEQVNRLFKNINKFKEAGVKIAPPPTNQVVQIYDVNVEFYQLDKDRFRDQIKKAETPENIERILHLTKESYDRYQVLERELALGKPVEKELQTIDDLLLRYKNDLYNYLKKTVYIKKADEENLNKPNMVAHFLIKRTYGYEENMNNIACRIFDNNRSFFLSGDMEMPLEIQMMMDGRELACDVYVLAHHDSFTSNDVLYLAEMMMQSLEQGKFPILVSTISQADKKKYRELNESKFDLLEAVRLTTVGGTINFEIKDGIMYIKQDGILNELYEAYINLDFELRNPDINDKMKTLISNKKDQIYSHIRNGLPLDEFIKSRQAKAYDKMSNISEKTCPDKPYIR